MVRGSFGRILGAFVLACMHMSIVTAGRRDVFWEPQLYQFVKDAKCNFECKIERVVRSEEVLTAYKGRTLSWNVVKRGTLKAPRVLSGKRDLPESFNFEMKRFKSLGGSRGRPRMDDVAYAWWRAAIQPMNANAVVMASNLDPLTPLLGRRKVVAAFISLPEQQHRQLVEAIRSLDDPEFRGVLKENQIRSMYECFRPAKAGRIVPAAYVLAASDSYPVQFRRDLLSEILRQEGAWRSAETIELVRRLWESKKEDYILRKMSLEFVVKYWSKIVQEDFATSLKAPFADKSYSNVESFRSVGDWKGFPLGSRSRPEVLGRLQSEFLKLSGGLR